MSDKISATWTHLPDANAWKLSVVGVRARGMNGSDGLLRMHYFRRAKYQETITALVKTPGCPPSLNGRVRVLFARGYKARPMDVDNLHSSAKPILDALRKARVIQDDNPEAIHFEAVQRKHKELGCDWQLIVQAGTP